MCVGIPMRVLEPEGARYAWCTRDGYSERVDMSLVGVQPEGAWVLVFLGSAREVLDAERAAQIDNALQALEAVSKGESVDAFFADLIDREPPLPDFLKPSHSVENNS